jgi:hypothetical protein
MLPELEEMSVLSSSQREGKGLSSLECDEQDLGSTIVLVGCSSCLSLSLLSLLYRETDISFDVAKATDLSAVGTGKSELSAIGKSDKCVATPCQMWYDRPSPSLHPLSWKTWIRLSGDGDGDSGERTNDVGRGERTGGDGGDGGEKGSGGGIGGGTWMSMSKRESGEEGT